MADIYLMVVFFLICNTGGACGDIVGSLPSRGLLPPGTGCVGDVLLQCYFRNSW